VEHALGAASGVNPDGLGILVARTWVLKHEFERILPARVTVDLQCQDQGSQFTIPLPCSPKNSSKGGGLCDILDSQRWRVQGVHVAVCIGRLSAEA